MVVFNKGISNLFRFCEAGGGCTFSCGYCFENIRNISMDNSTINQTIHFLKEYLSDHKYRGLHVTWFGGEPLLFINIIENYYTKISDLCLSLDIELSNDIITNGTLLTDEACNTLKKMKNLELIQITIDGCKEIHDIRRPMALGSSFDLIINNLTRYLDFFPFHIRINIDKSNIEDIEKLVEFLSNIPNLKEKCTVHFAKIVGDMVSCYTNKEFAYKYSECCNFLEKYGFKNTTSKLIPQVNAVQCPSLTKHHLLIDANGDLYKCWQLVGQKEYCIGSVFTGFSKPKKDLIETEHETCVNCCVYPICHTGCPLHYDEVLTNNCRYIPELLINDIESYIVYD